METRQTKDLTDGQWEIYAQLEYDLNEKFYPGEKE